MPKKKIKKTIKKPIKPRKKKVTEPTPEEIYAGLTKRQKRRQRRDLGL